MAPREFIDALFRTWPFNFFSDSPDLPWLPYASKSMALPTFFHDWASLWHWQLSADFLNANKKVLCVWFCLTQLSAQAAIESFFFFWSFWLIDLITTGQRHKKYNSKLSQNNFSQYLTKTPPTNCSPRLASCNVSIECNLFVFVLFVHEENYDNYLESSNNGNWS